MDFIKKNNLCSNDLNLNMKITRLTIKSIPICSMLAFVSLQFAACGGAKDGGDIFSNIAEIFETGIDPAVVQQTLDSSLTNYKSNRDAAIAAQIRNLYEGQDFKLIWHDDKKLNAKANKALASFDGLTTDGINPVRYFNKEHQLFFDKKNVAERDAVDRDIMLSLQLAHAAYDLTFGVLDPKEIDKEWHTDNDSVFAFADKVLAFEKSENDFFEAFRPQHKRYKQLQAELNKWERLSADSNYLEKKTIVSHVDQQDLLAIMQQEMELNAQDSDLVKVYQYVNHIATSGKIDDATRQVLERSPEEYINLVKINMERMRWLPNELNLDNYVWVSIPQAEVDYFKDGNNLFHNRTIVGAKTNRTPSISKPMKNIVICPPWGLPHSIVKNDYNGKIPAKYEVYKGGKRVPNNMVNASNYKQFTVRQPPGPGAALGYVKFNLPNKWDIYLHDTPNRSLFGNKNRYLSHGCVRVKNPRELAALILESKGVSVDSINTLIAKNKTVHIPTGNIPVYINYFTANADSNINKVIYLNDPYKKDSVLRSKLLAME
jgi:murein L,D-transpeptidase YcbB/YkuD